MGAKSPIQPVGPESWRNIPSEPFIGIPRSVKLCTEEKVDTNLRIAQKRKEGEKKKAFRIVLYY